MNAASVSGGECQKGNTLKTATQMKALLIVPLQNLMLWSAGTEP